MHATSDLELISTDGDPWTLAHRMPPFNAKLKPPLDQTTPKHITKWNTLLGFSPNWPKLFAQLQFSYIPLKSRNVLIRIFHHNLQVRDRFHFLTNIPANRECNQCSAHFSETLEHCLFTCQRIMQLSSLLRLTYFHFYRTRLSSHWDILFNSDPHKKISQPWLLLRAIALHTIWSTRCQSLLTNTSPVPYKSLTQEILKIFEVRIQGLYHIKCQKAGPKAHREQVSFCKLFTDTIPMFTLPSAPKLTFPTLSPSFTTLWGCHQRVEQDTTHTGAAGTSVLPRTPPPLARGNRGFLADPALP